MLSISKCVFSYGYPNSINTSCRSIPILAFAHAATISASKTALITFYKILDPACIKTLISYCYIVISFDSSHILPKKWYSPTILLAFGIDKNDESDNIHRIISNLL